MAPPSIRGTATQASSGSSGGNANVTKPTGLAVGDLIVAWALGDNDTVTANLTGPAGWTLQATQAATVNQQPAMKIWTQIATSTETAATTFTFTAGTGAWVSCGIIAFQTATFDSTTPLSQTPQFNILTTNSATQTAPSLTPGVNDGMLCTAHGTDTGGTASTYTPPTGMTEQIDTSNTGSFSGLEVNTLALTSTAATGTKDATCSLSRPYTCASLIVNPVVSGPNLGVRTGGFLAILGL